MSDSVVSIEADSRYNLPKMAIIVPTFNEKDNISALVEAISRELASTEYEIVFVDDDSTDGTIEILRSHARRDARIRFIHRIGRRGLSSAVIEGIQSTSTPYVAVIDADLQHDESLLPTMLRLLESGEADIAVGSRYSTGASIGEWAKPRVLLSSLATRLANAATGLDLCDPLSGFFAITRSAFDGAVRQLSGQGYKILLDICASSRGPLKIYHLPYNFRVRKAGKSKLDMLIGWEFLLLLCDKILGGAIPVKLLSFAFIGGSAALVHMIVLALNQQAKLVDFFSAQTVACLVALVFNFQIQNILTYRDRRLSGLRDVVSGLLKFMAVCSVGVVANVSLAAFLFYERQVPWWLAGLAGIVAGSAWNYAASANVNCQENR